ncbi:hypothetical protein HK101_003357 [Irineochytrium annulatum]|nr:hypothetical protein HK101_003357 [Irineochytrium annulatum]
MYCVAMDCEMVGVGRKGRRSILARVSIVDSDGDVLLDRYVLPEETVTDYRTFVSGITASDLTRANGAKRFGKTRDVLIDPPPASFSILIGHDLPHDFEVLNIRHPKAMTRDTAYYGPFQRYATNDPKPRLRTLARHLVGMEIQSGAHSSVEDAWAVMCVYDSLRPHALW